MNVLTDFGFKRMFGTERFKHILIRFLNVLFEPEGIKVTQVKFHDKEVLPPTPEGKRIVYDVYCTTPGDKEHFILEMQQEHHTNFEERMMYYIAKGLSEQGKTGESYNFSPVYGIFFVDFQFRHLSRKLIHDFRMREMETGEVFSNILRMLFVSLTEVKQEWEDCKTELERILFLIKNMHKMDKNSAAYKCKEYDDMFKASEIGSFAKEDIVAYKESARAYEDRVLYWDSGYNDGYEKGVAKGRNEGREEGREEGIVYSIKKLASAGINPLQISDIFSISVEEVELILSSE